MCVLASGSIFPALISTEPPAAGRSGSAARTAKKHTQRARRQRAGDREAVDNRNYAGVQGVLGPVQRERAGPSWVYGMVGMLFDLVLGLLWVTMAFGIMGLLDALVSLEDMVSLLLDEHLMKFIDLGPRYSRLRYLYPAFTL
jgi:hypothetical protein